MRSRRSSWILLSALARSSLVRLAGADQQPLTLGYLPITDHLTVIAQQQGTFSRANFSVVKFGSWPELAEALKGGAIDGAFVLAPIALTLRQKGVPLRAVLLGHRNGSVITVKIDGPIHTLADLKGRTIAIPSRFSTHNILLQRMLAAQHIEVDGDTHIIELAPPEMVTALATGRIDAFIVAEPFGAQAEIQKVGRVLALSKDIWPDHICCVLNLRQEAIDRAPEAVQEVVTALVQAAASISADPGAAAAASAQFLGQKPEVILHVLTEPKGRVTYAKLTPELPDFAVTQDALIALGLLKGPVDLAAYLEPRFAEKAYQIVK